MSHPDCVRVCPYLANLVTRNTAHSGGAGTYWRATRPRTPEKMLVSRGGEPERDDYGLPPVDIEIPDDARELERDVQVYHRELRALRRQRLLRRLGGPIARDGMVLPLLASCLALTLLAGTLLTMFTTRRADAPVTQAQTPTTPQSASPSPGQIGGPLPASTVQADGKPVKLSTVKTAVLALVPAGCHCAAAARQVSQQATAANVAVYLIAVGRSVSQVKAMALKSGQTAAILVASDTHGALTSAYHPSGLTVVLVDQVGSVRSVQRNLRPDVQLGDSLHMLGHVAPQSLDGPGASVLAANQPADRAA
jgi:hypothetical protein